MYMDSKLSTISLELDKVRLDSVSEYVKESDRYSIEEYLKSINQFDDSEGRTQSDNIIVSCPFHSDSTPSFSINTNRNIFKCFSCGRAGGYLKLVHEWENYNGKEISISNLAEKLLRNDMIMANELGFNTIFIRSMQKKDYSDFSLRRPQRIKEFDTETFLSLAKKMNRNRASLSDKILMISLMQSGISVNEVSKMIDKRISPQRVQTLDDINTNIGLDNNEEFDIESILELGV